MKRLKKHIKPAALAGALLATLGLLGALAAVVIALSTLPSLELLSSRRVSESTKIFDRAGTTLLYEIYDEEKRTVVPLTEIPLYAQQAAIAIEDANFYSHSAIDFKALLRALLNNISGTGRLQGGSTITQQLAKKAFLTDDRTIMRKIREAFISYRLEQRYSKDEILALYLNQIPYGNNSYGIEAASQTYFQLPARSLSLAQAALLAALPQAPSYYSPFGTHVEELMQRKNLVLKRMRELGYISEDERMAAEQEKFTFTQMKRLEVAPHFVLSVRQYLEEKYGEDFVRRAGLKVITTLDVKLQKAAEQVVAVGAARNQELYKGTNAAMVVLDPKTGQIKALVGSRNYFDTEIDGQFNVASLGRRQPGSALKPFIYLAALEKGYPEQTVLFDVPTEFYPNTTLCPNRPPFAEKDPTSTTQSPCFHPENFDHRYAGPVSLRAALAQSRNVPAVKALYLVGISEAVSFLNRFGITSLTDPNRYGLSLVLGGGEVSLEELVGAYGVLADEGLYHERSMILSVRDQAGRLLEEYRDRVAPVAEAESVRVINDMLADAEARRPLFSGSLGLTVFDGYDVALKTGTTNDYRDAWAVGYTPNLVAGVWAGNNDNTPMQKQGGSILAAIPMLSNFLREALPETQPEAFAAPSAPTLVSKPMLNGSHLAYFQAAGELLPQVHNILYYVNRLNPRGSVPTNPWSDPQFTNWEVGVEDWITQTIPGASLGVSINRPLPPGAVLVEPVRPEQAKPSNPAAESSGAAAQGTIVITSPEPGGFMRNGSVTINAAVALTQPITRIDLYFNGALADSRVITSGSITYYNTTITRLDALPQNTLMIRATDLTGASLSKEVVVYR